MAYNEPIMGMKKSVPLFLLAALACLLLPVSCSRPERPNVVVIVIDTLRTDHLHFHGYGRDTTPFLTALAARSADFTRAYAGSSWTAPATASIFTGLYPFQHGVVMGLLAQKQSLKKDPTIQINRIPDKVRTMPEFFKDNGYRTFGISDNPNISHKQGFHQGFDRLQTHRHAGARNLNEKLLAWEKEIAAADPYFLYIHYNDPHRPYKLKLSPEEQTGVWLDDMKRRYDKEVALVDGCIRELYRRFGWERDTLLVITADHGEEMMEKGFYGHGLSLYNTVIRVPLLFHFPGSRRVLAGPVAAEVSTLDILPTLGSLLGFAKLGGLAGVDIGPLLQDRSGQIPERTLFSHLQLKAVGKPDRVQKAAIAGDLKYIFQAPEAVSLLFDLQQDPRERENLYSLRLADAKKLAASYFSFERGCRRYNPDYVDIQLDAKSIEHLKTLGYIQ